MAVKIRLQRFGAHKNPQYRIVASDSKSPRDGKFLEVLGTFNPIANPAIVNVNLEATNKWINNGAQPTDTVKSLIKNA